MTSMRRRDFLALTLPLLAGAGDRVVKTEAEWKKLLTPEQYRVTRKKGTERAFKGPNWDNHAKGTRPTNRPRRVNVVTVR